VKKRNLAPLVSAFNLADLVEWLVFVAESKSKITILLFYYTIEKLPITLIMAFFLRSDQPSSGNFSCL
jgi:hypothetical protein